MFRFFQKPAGRRRSVDALDYKLVRNASSRIIPTPAQTKYLFHFLSPKEKALFLTFFIASVLSLVTIAGLFLGKHFSFIPNYGGEYSEALVGQPKYINPLYAGVNDVDQDLTSLTYSGLFKFDEQKKLVPDLAESYTVSTDTKTYVIELKKGIKFADGKPFTANDVVFTFDMIQNPEVASPLSAAFQGVKIDRLNDNEVSFTLKESYAPFLESLTVGILPEHIWSDISPTAIRIAANNLKPIGTGPWKFNKMVKDSTGHISALTFDRNENFYGKRPYFDTLRFKFFDDYGAALEALKSQNVSALSFIPNFSSVKFNNKNIKVYPLHFPEYTALFLNQSSQPILKDYDVRLALAKAVDKNYLTQSVLNNTAEPIDSPFLPGSAAYSEEIKKIAFDVADANNLLDKKWTRLQPEEYFQLRRTQILKDINPITATSSQEQAVDENTISENIRAEMNPDQTFYRKDKDNNVLQLTITTSDSSEYGKAAEAIASEWRKIGVKVTIEKINVARLLRESIRYRSYQVLLYSEITGNDPDPYPFWHSSQTEYPGLNLSGFSNRNADKLLEDSRVTSDDQTRTQNYIKFQDILTSELPAIFLYSPWHAMAINNEIKGVNISTLNIPSDRFVDLSNWYIKTKLRWN